MPKRDLILFWLALLGTLTLMGCQRHWPSRVPGITMEFEFPTAREDRDVRKVTINPEFRITEYRSLMVSEFSAHGVKTNQVLSPEEAKVYLKAKLLEKMADADVFEEVTEAEEPALTSSDRILLLEGAILELEPASRTLHLAGYENPKAIISVDTRLRDPKAGKVFVITRHRRETALGFLKGDGRRHLLESLEKMAEDIADAIKGLSAGNEPSNAE